MDRYSLKQDDLTGDIDLVISKTGELVKYEEAERLKKEKEWLMDRIIDLEQRRTTTDMPPEEMKEIILEEMQQVLKER